jgi:hypothetical protein
MAYIGNTLESQAITPAVDTFSGNGVTTTFTLSRRVVSNIAVEAFVNNVPQNPNTAFAINASNQIVFDGAPIAGSNNIYVRYNGYVGQNIGIGQGTVQPTSMSTGGPQWDANGNLSINGSLIEARFENLQTTSYTLALTDNGDVVAMNNSAAAVVTVPPNSIAPFPIGAVVYICRVGTGAVTLAAGSGVTLTRTGSFTANEEIYIRKRGTDSWIVVDSPRILSGGGGTVSTVSGFRINTFDTVGNSTFTVS